MVRGGWLTECACLSNCVSGPLVDTFAGSGQQGTGGDGGPAKEATFTSLKGIAVNLARGELVIADADMGRISTIHLSTGILAIGAVSETTLS